MMRYNSAVGTRNPDLQPEFYYPRSTEMNEYTRMVAELQNRNNFVNSKATALGPDHQCTYVGTTPVGGQQYCYPYLDVNVLNGYGMTGTPVGSYLLNTSYICRVIQHCLPPEVYQSYLDKGYKCFIKLEQVSVSATPLLSKNINGYTSTANASYSGNVHKVVDFIYYDDSTGYVMRYNPFEMSTPVRYYSS